MHPPINLPPFNDVARFGNMVFSAWAPPASRTLASAWLRAVLDSLLASGQAAYIIGYRPGALSNAPAQAIPAGTLAMLEQLVPEPIWGPLHRLPDDSARASLDTLLAGSLNARWTLVDESTGHTRVKSISLGRPLLTACVDAVAHAVRSTAAEEPLQIHVACLANPEAGLRQPDARWMRSLKSGAGGQLALTWLGNSNALCVSGGREALWRLHLALANGAVGHGGEA